MTTPPTNTHNTTLMGPPPLPTSTPQKHNLRSNPRTPPPRGGGHPPPPSSPSLPSPTTTQRQKQRNLLTSNKNPLEQQHPSTHLRRKRLFSAIFPPSVSESFALGGGAAGDVREGSGGVGEAEELSPPTPTPAHTAVEQKKSIGAKRDWESTWHVATTFLAFPGEGFSKAKAGGGGGNGGWREVRDAYVRGKRRDGGPRVEDAVRALVEREREAREREKAGVGAVAGAAEHKVQSLVEWYTWEVRRHYLAHVRPGIMEMLFSEEGDVDGEGAAMEVEDGDDVGGAGVDDEVEREDRRSKRKLERLLEMLRTAWEIYVAVGRRWIVPKQRAGGKRDPRDFFSTPGRGDDSDDTQEDNVGDDDDDDGSDGSDAGGDYAGLGDGGDEGGEDEDDDPRMAKFIRSLNAIISYSLPDPQWSTLVYQVFMQLCGVILNSQPEILEEGEGDVEGQAQGVGISTTTATTEDSQKTIKDADDIIEADDEDIPTQKDPMEYYGITTSTPAVPSTTPSVVRKPRKLTPAQAVAQASLLAIWKNLQVLNLGGGGRRGERVFAEVINVIVTRYIESMYAQQWSSEDEHGRHRDVMREIGNWVEHDVGPLVRLVLVGDDDEESSKEKLRRRRKKKRSKAAAAATARRKRRHGKEKALSPRASFRALELGIGGGSLRKSAARPRISIDGVMMGEARRIGEMIMMEGLGRSSMRSSLSSSVDVMEEDEEEDADVGDVVLRKEDIEGWKKMALGRLGRLRVGELFDIMVDWPDSLGGIMDLRAYISTPQTRLHLTASFTTAISNRILHPAASTTDILRVYISIIRAFSVLDPRGVLLDRVTRGIRRYLREREDTVRVIVRGLMGGNRGSGMRKDDESGQQDKLGGGIVAPGNRMDDDDLSDLAEELVKGSRGASSGDPNAAGGPNGGDELDFDDLSWVPDPVDAGPEYRKVKGTDVIGSLMSLYESKEVFVREFQAVLAERLLECRERYTEASDSEEEEEEEDDEDTEAWRNYEPEIQTLELLRLRFGEGPLQSCDVMLRDIQVGQRTDANVRRDQHLDSSIAKNAGGVQFHAKILSHLFWPGQMRDEGTVPPQKTVYTADGDEKKLPYFIPPPGIVALQKKYEVGFSKLNGKRVLEWRDLLGSVQLDVQLEDRVVGVEDAKTWAVAALEAFEVAEGEDVGKCKDEAGRVRRSVRYLREKLAMDEGLVRRALGYWREKGVLREVGGGGSSEREEWVVVERLSDLEGEAEGSGGHAGGSRKTPQQEASKEVEQEAEEAEPPLSQEKVVYAQFIMGMLTNAPGAMPVERIMMMLGMLVPGGVRCGVGEMGELLERLAREGKVEFVGGGWKVKK